MAEINEIVRLAFPCRGKETLTEVQDMMIAMKHELERSAIQDTIMSDLLLPDMPAEFYARHLNIAYRYYTNPDIDIDKHHLIYAEICLRFAIISKHILDTYPALSPIETLLSVR